MKAENPRVARTKGYLKEAMIELLRTVPFENITIKALCQKAAVNRSTFYVYYSCPRDLIEEIEADILSKLPDYVGGKPFYESILPFMQYLKDNATTFRILLSSSADTSFGEQIISAAMAKYNEIATVADKDEKRMSFIYCVNGVVGIVREWISSGFEWSVERITRLVVELTFRSVGLDVETAFPK